MTKLLQSNEDLNFTAMEAKEEVSLSSWLQFLLCSDQTVRRQFWLEGENVVEWVWQDRVYNKMSCFKWSRLSRLTLNYHSVGAKTDRILCVWIPIWNWAEFARIEETAILNKGQVNVSQICTQSDLACLSNAGRRHCGYDTRRTSPM